MGCSTNRPEVSRTVSYLVMYLLYGTSAYLRARYAPMRDAQASHDVLTMSCMYRVKP